MLYTFAHTFIIHKSVEFAELHSTVFFFIAVRLAEGLHWGDKTRIELRPYTAALRATIFATPHALWRSYAASFTASHLTKLHSAFHAQIHTNNYSNQNLLSRTYGPKPKLYALYIDIIKVFFFANKSAKR